MMDQIVTVGFITYESSFSCQFMYAQYSMTESLYRLLYLSPAKRTTGQMRRASCTAAHMPTPDITI